MRAVLGVIGLSVLIFANYVDESAAADQLGSNMQCEPGSRFRHECNWCGCTKEGWMICTTRFCAPESAVVAVAGGGHARSSDQLGGNMQCKPGSRFRQKCNWCTCSRQGLKLCTKRMCRPGADFSKEPQCEGDAVFLDEENCNTCSCHNGIAACTFKICPKSAAVAVPGGGRARSSDQLGGNMQCKPGSRFRQKCNWCTCSRQGLKVCTKRMCRPGADFSKELQCEGDAMFLDEENCNWCSCHNGIAACTLKICPNLALDQDDHVDGDQQGTNQSVTSDPSGIV